jgi:hypothetical protein
LPPACHVLHHFNRQTVHNTQEEAKRTLITSLYPFYRRNYTEQILG